MHYIEVTNTSMLKHFASNLALTQFEKLLKLAIRLDPTTTRRLKALSARMNPASLLVHIPIGMTQISVLITLANESIHLTFDERSESDPTRRPPTATISAPPLTLLMLVRKNQHRGQTPLLKLEGDMLFLQEFQSILQGFHFDWEEQLSLLIGDVMTQNTKDVIDAAQVKGTKLNETLLFNVSEYLIEEAALVPPRWQVNEFMDNVDTLRLQCDRLTARISRLLKGSE